MPSVPDEAILQFPSLTPARSNNGESESKSGLSVWKDGMAAWTKERNESSQALEPTSLLFLSSLLFLRECCSAAIRQDNLHHLDSL